MKQCPPGKFYNPATGKCESTRTYVGGRWLRPDPEDEDGNGNGKKSKGGKKNGNGSAHSNGTNNGNGNGGGGVSEHRRMKTFKQFITDT